MQLRQAIVKCWQLVGKVQAKLQSFTKIVHELLPTNMVQFEKIVSLQRAVRETALEIEGSCMEKSKSNF